MAPKAADLRGAGARGFASANSSGNIPRGGERFVRRMQLAFLAAVFFKEIPLQGPQVIDVLALIEKEGLIDLSGLLPPSAFKDELSDIVRETEADGGVAGRKLVHALEALFTRQHLDGQLLIAVCIALKELSGLSMAKLVKRVDQARVHLKMPSPSWLAKNIKAARVVDAHPELRDLGDIEKLCALDRLPDDVLSEAVQSGVLTLSGRDVDIRSATRREVGAAVRQARGLAGPARKEEGPAEAAAKVAAALAADDDRHELLMAPSASSHAAPERQLRGGSVDARPPSYGDRAQAVDFFLENYLGGDPSLRLGLQLAAAERVLTRLQGGLLEHPELNELRLATAKTLAQIEVALEHLDPLAVDPDASWPVPPAVAGSIDR